MGRRVFATALIATLVTLLIVNVVVASTIVVDNVTPTGMIAVKIGQPLEKQLGWPDGICEADVTLTADFTGTLPGRFTLNGYAYFSCADFVAGNATFTMPKTRWKLETADGTLSGTGPGLLGQDPVNPNFTLNALKGNRALRGATGTLELQRDVAGQIRLTGTLEQ